MKLAFTAAAKVLVMLCMAFVSTNGAKATDMKDVDGVLEDTSVAEPKVKKLQKGEYITIFMGREARNITVDWAEGSKCEFEIQISCGLGSFVSLGNNKCNGPGRETYNFCRTTVEELRIVIVEGQGNVGNMQTLSTKADDNESYNPI